MGRCCNASRWVAHMVAGRPYTHMIELLATAERHWSVMTEPDWLEAFDGHPRIGDPESLKEKYHATLMTASGEQSSINQADANTLDSLAEENQSYFNRFGFIFIVFARDKSAREMLVLLRNRLGNDRQTELSIAAAEQWKITRSRLEGMFGAVGHHTA